MSYGVEVRVLSKANKTEFGFEDFVQEQSPQNQIEKTKRVGIQAAKGCGL